MQEVERESKTGLSQAAAWQRPVASSQASRQQGNQTGQAALLVATSTPAQLRLRLWLRLWSGLMDACLFTASLFVQFSVIAAVRCVAAALLPLLWQL